MTINWEKIRENDNWLDYELKQRMALQSLYRTRLEASSVAAQLMLDGEDSPEASIAKKMKENLDVMIHVCETDLDEILKIQAVNGLMHELNTVPEVPKPVTDSEKMKALADPALSYDEAIGLLEDLGFLGKKAPPKKRVRKPKKPIGGEDESLA